MTKNEALKQAIQGTTPPVEELHEDNDVYVEPKVDDIHETVSQFEQRVASALAMGEEILETTQGVINLYNPRGLGANPWFHFRGIMVCKYGDKDKVYETLTMQHGVKTYGKSEGVVEGR